MPTDGCVAVIEGPIDSQKHADERILETTKNVPTDGWRAVVKQRVDLFVGLAFHTGIPYK